MANEISTAGICLKYCTETTAGTFPTASYTAVANIKSIPDMNVSPSTIDVTDLAQTEFKQYIFGLKDFGGDLAFSVNFTENLKTTWNAFCETAATAYEAGKNTWFEVKIPNWTESFFFAGIPSKFGMVSAEVDSALEGEIHIAPVQVKGWATAST